MRNTSHSPQLLSFNKVDVDNIIISPFKYDPHGPIPVWSSRIIFNNTRQNIFKTKFVGPTKILLNTSKTTPIKSWHIKIYRDGIKTKKLFDKFTQIDNFMRRYIRSHKILNIPPNKLEYIPLISNKNDDKPYCKFRNKLQYDVTNVLKFIKGKQIKFIFSMNLVSILKTHDNYKIHICTPSMYNLVSRNYEKVEPILFV